MEPALVNHETKRVVFIYRFQQLFYDADSVSIHVLCLVPLISHHHPISKIVINLINRVSRAASCLWAIKATYFAEAVLSVNWMVGCYIWTLSFLLLIDSFFEGFLDDPVSYESPAENNRSDDTTAGSRRLYPPPQIWFLLNSLQCSPFRLFIAFDCHLAVSLKVSKCQDVKISKCQSLKVSACQNAKGLLTTNRTGIIVNQ